MYTSYNKSALTISTSTVLSSFKLFITSKLFVVSRAHINLATPESKEIRCIGISSNKCVCVNFVMNSGKLSVLLSLVAPRGGSNVPAVVLSGDLNGGEVSSLVKSGSLGKSKAKLSYKHASLNAFLVQNLSVLYKAITF